jgi:hypothetical protein
MAPAYGYRLPSWTSVAPEVAPATATGNQELMNSRMSALMTSAWVVGIPWG